MKKVIVGCLFLLAGIVSSQGQTLFGTTANEGEFGGGSIYKFLPSSQSFIVTKSFESVESDPYYTNLIMANDGKLYGMTFRGGRTNNGAIFSFAPLTKTYTVLHEFNN